MNRDEFLEILNIQLQGEIPSNEILQHLAYYSSFIDQEIQKGTPEQDVLDGLGDPRLIAKTLIDTEDVPNRPGYQQSYAYSAQEAGQREGGPAWEEDSPQDPQEGQQPQKTYRLDLSTWQGKLKVIAAAVLLAAILVLVLSALLPAVAIAAVVGIILALVSRPRR